MSAVITYRTHTAHTLLPPPVPYALVLPLQKVDALPELAHVVKNADVLITNLSHSRVEAVDEPTIDDHYNEEEEEEDDEVSK